MKMQFGLLIGAAIAVLTAGLYFTLGNVASYPNEMPLVPKKPDSSDLLLEVRPEMEHSLAAAERELSFLRSELAKLKQVDAKTNQLNSELAKLRQEVISLHERFAALAIENNPDDDVSEAEDLLDKDQLTANFMQADAEQLEYENLKQMAVIDSFFQAETIDEQWSYDTSQMVIDTFQNIDPEQTVLSRAQCHSTLCLVEVEHSDATTAAEFSLYFTMNVGEALPHANFYYENFDDGSMRVTMYFVREGYNLPQLVQ